MEGLSCDLIVYKEQQTVSSSKDETQNMLGLNDALILQLEGTILAPTNAKAWGSGLLQWLEFTKLNGLSIQGSGTINGRGQQWWTYSDPNDNEDDDTVRPDEYALYHTMQKLFY
jgi:hypothetical protein